MAEHTATPWQIGEAVNDYEEVVRGPKGEYVCRAGRNLSEKRENAAFIVRAVNCHDDLADALRDSWKLVAELEDAINKGLKLLPADVTRIAESCEASRAAIAKASA